MHLNSIEINIRKQSERKNEKNNNKYAYYWF